ncbi:BMP family ABC transporter substrate-binding protein [Irregularibacter muris]|uniref:BMP family ABC transporter substrate-binding protein n=1 Tax=Irregularibacter muris TaxID=1796619 RepID=A0AAE3HFI4_9FIRM|nr:BMP family ABC transporter substrate-binding protein [Irregularibacter muris]MCR1898509.1 BMP family ABC transporter substrate-binding protein [Irregularibacter muris]
MTKKLLVLLLVLGLVMTAFVGCSSGDTTPEGEPEDQEPAAGEDAKITMVTDVGGVNDNSFNQSAWEGLQKSEKDLGVEVAYIESKDASDYVANLESALDAENDLIWGIGFLMGDDILKAAQDNTDQKYAIIDMAYDDTPENLIGVVFQAEQPSFLVGYIAGKMTETGKVGFVGGEKSAVIDGFDYGFHAGVKFANPDVEVFRQYADNFNDVAKGKAIATKMFQDGADIVFHAAGATGDGVIEAAKEQDKWAIGVDRDQSDLAPENVLTSAMKRVDNAVYNIAKDLKEGKFQGGETVVYGLKENGVDIAPTSDKHVPADLLKEVEDLKQQMIDGKIVVPFDEKTFEDFKVE